MNVPATAANLVVTELNYNPYAPEDPTVDKELYEFAELKNVGPREIDLTNVRFAIGVTYSFTGSAVPYLAAAHVLVVKDLARFRERYGDIPNVAGTYVGSLSNSGERIRLIDATGSTIADFTYDDEASWPTAPDGHGKPFVAIDPTGNLNSSASWRERRAWRLARPAGRHRTRPGHTDGTQHGRRYAADGNRHPDQRRRVAAPVPARERHFRQCRPGLRRRPGGLGNRRTTASWPSPPRETRTGQRSSRSRSTTVPAASLQGKSFVLTVVPVNDRPVAVADSYTTDEDTPLLVQSKGVLANDTDAEDDDFLPGADSSLPRSLVARRRWEFHVPPVGQLQRPGLSFTYQASDGQLTSAAVTVSLTIAAVNDPPTLAPIADETVAEGSLLQFRASTPTWRRPPVSSPTPWPRALPSGMIIDSERES